MNVVTVTGNLTKDPEMGQNGTGQEVCRLRVGLGRGRHSHSVYTDVKVFGTEARRCLRYLTKGRAVAITGWLEFTEWIGRDGIKRSRLYVGTTNVDFLGSLTAGPEHNGSVTGGFADAARDLDEVAEEERFDDFDDLEALGEAEDLTSEPELDDVDALPDLDDEQVEGHLDLRLHS